LGTLPLKIALLLRVLLTLLLLRTLLFLLSLLRLSRTLLLLSTLQLQLTLLFLATLQLQLTLLFLLPLLLRQLTLLILATLQLQLTLLFLLSLALLLLALFLPTLLLLALFLLTLFLLTLLLLSLLLLALLLLALLLLSLLLLPLLLLPLLLLPLLLLPLLLLALLLLALLLLALVLLALVLLALVLLALLVLLPTRFEILLRDRLARLVAVMLGPYRMLLFDCARIAVAGIVPLVSRQRSRRRGGAVVPTVPPASTPLPVATPVIPPTGRRVGTPAAEIRWRLAVVANGDAQHISRHIVITHVIPRPVVPAARIPVVALEHPVEAVVKEEIRIHPGRVVDGIARYRDKIRVRRIIDADADTRISRAIAGWLVGGSGIATLGKGHRYRNHQVALFHLQLLPQIWGHRFGDFPRF